MKVGGCVEEWSIGLKNNTPSLVSAPITRWRLVPAPPFYSLDGNDTTRDIVDPAVVIDSSTLSSSTPFASSSSSWSSMLNSIIRLTFPKAKEKDDLAGITASMDMSPDGLHIACVLFSGEVVVWNADKGPPTFENVKQRWTCTDLDTLFSDDAMTHAKVASVTWWTNESLAIALSDGRFTVVTIAVSADQQPLIDVVDEFGPGVIILRHVDKLLLLNSTIETFIVRRRKDGFVQWRAADSTVEKNGVDCTGTTSTTVIATNRPSLGTTLNLAWSIVLRPVRLITDTFLWNFDNDAERNWLPDITVHARSFTLSLVRETKPKELLLHRVRLRQFDEALELASEFSLDTDVIYKAYGLCGKNISGHS